MLDNRGPQVVKALTESGFDHYYQADLKGRGRYREGSTELAVLRAFARTLDHPFTQELERPFAHCLSRRTPRSAPRGADAKGRQANVRSKGHP